MRSLENLKFYCVGELCLKWNVCWQRIRYFVIGHSTGLAVGMIHQLVQWPSKNARTLSSVSTRSELFIKSKYLYISLSTITLPFRVTHSLDKQNDRLILLILSFIVCPVLYGLHSSFQAIFYLIIRISM